MDEKEWPYRATREEMDAADAALAEAEKVYGRASREWRVANCKRSRSRWLKVRVRRPPSRLRADEEYRLRLIAENGKKRVAQAEKAIESLYDLASQGRSAVLMRRFVTLAETYGPDIMEEQLKNESPLIRWKALAELIGLLKCAYKTEEEKAPKRPPQARKVVVRDWPAEGAKS